MSALRRLAPLVILALVGVALRALHLASNVSLPLERVLGQGLVVLFTAGLLREAWRVRSESMASLTSPGAKTAFGALCAALLLLYAAVTRMITLRSGSGALRVERGDGFGPLTVWPSLDFAWPSMGLAGHFPLGRVLLGVAVAATVATALCVVFERSGASLRARGAGLAGVTAPALFTGTACVACAPPLALALMALGGSAAVPVASALANPASPAVAALDFGAPTLAAAGLLLIARPGKRCRGRGGEPVPRLTGWAAFSLLPLLALFGFPRGASTLQEANYKLFWIAVVGSAALGLVTLGLLAYFTLRYRRVEWLRPPAPTMRRGRERALKVVIVVVPALVIFGIGALSHDVLLDLEGGPPVGTVHVDVEGRRFSWFFTYPNGTASADEVRVPVGEVVWLNVTSRDVIHSFFVPDLGVKIDAVPGGTTRAWFKATETGAYRLFCAEFCGVGHADMRGRVIVEP